LVRRRLARSREHARELIAHGAVRVGGLAASKPATQVEEVASIAVTTADSGANAYASRGALKLVGAIEELARRGRPVRVSGLVCLDAGASTGGFTDVLLRAGAATVHAVDVGYGQLAWRLRQDPRVQVHDRVNIRHLAPEAVRPAPALVVADLSFISLTTVMPALAAAAARPARFLLLVKPQFEVGREKLPPGGVVTDRADRAGAVEKVAAAAREAGLAVHDAVRSPLPGPSGNVEFFLDLDTASPGSTPDEVAAAAWREAS
jgi:23S rRNA (cytidine1920-2'-O)/16S rRNA (cytidine1409-2'-O)-methyltransferase